MVRPASIWKQSIKMGVIGGVTAVLLALVGMVESFSQRDIVARYVSMGHTLILIVPFFVGYLTAKRRSFGSSISCVAAGALSGLMTGGALCLLTVLNNLVELRKVFINASPSLFDLLCFGQGSTIGALILAGTGATTGLLGALICLAPNAVRRVTIGSFGGVALSGMLQDLLRPIFSAWGPAAEINEWLFTANGLTLHGACSILLLVATGISLWMWRGTAICYHFSNVSPSKRRLLKIAFYSGASFVLIMLPRIVGLFLSEVLTTVGLYILMGFGLNVVVGYAGLLDLGYVAFYAIGAYVVAVLTSSELGFFNLSFWQAMPVAIVAGIVSGILLGLPVLKMRGDYLAITTLGFGEIIRILVLSDFLRPWLGGAQGIAKIGKISIGGMELITPQQIYYLILAGCVVVGFIAWRLRDSRHGRAWMAIREDEDVAQAMGINLVASKLMAFATGAAFSALSGAIFASKLGTVYPHSFNVMISINVLCVIIVGGTGSLTGVILGAMTLVGLPELLREFADHRLLIYGAALVAIMLLRPEGLVPAEVSRRQLRESSQDRSLSR